MRDPRHSLGLRDDPPAAFIGRFIDRRLKAYRNSGHFHARDDSAGLAPSRTERTGAHLACLASSWLAPRLEERARGRRRGPAG